MVRKFLSILLLVLGIFFFLMDLILFQNVFWLMASIVCSVLFVVFFMLPQIKIVQKKTKKTDAILICGMIIGYIAGFWIGYFGFHRDFASAPWSGCIGLICGMAFTEIIKRSRKI